MASRYSFVEYKRNGRWLRVDYWRLWSDFFLYRTVDIGAVVEEPEPEPEEAPAPAPETVQPTNKVRAQRRGRRNA